MKTLKYTMNVDVFTSVDELPEDIRPLMQQATQATNSAYAPYSGFEVGAAVLLENGKTQIGSNQENAAFPSGLCAERVAVYAAVTRFPQSKVKAVAIYAPGHLEKNYPLSPCGNCRQALSEYELRQEQNISIFLKGREDKIWHFKSVTDLLPFPFKLLK